MNIILQHVVLPFVVCGVLSFLTTTLILKASHGTRSRK